MARMTTYTCWINYPPKVAVSKLVNSLKGVSSLLIRKKNYPSIKKRLWGGALWSPSYFAGSCAQRRRLRSFASTSSSSGRRIKGKDGFAVRAYIPALNDP
jgi:hypothetical protein